jgi:hypothetical protein
MARPKKKKPARREPKRPGEPFAGFTDREKKIIHDLYRTLRKIVRKNGGNRKYPVDER